jgi:hypothetical protein
VTPLAEPVAAKRDELLHYRRHWIADARGLGFELDEIDLARAAMAFDLRGRFLRDDAKPRLRPRQRRLEVEVFLHAALVGKDPPHSLGGEDVAEDGGVDGGCGHCCSPYCRLWLTSSENVNALQNSTIGRIGSP